MKRLHINALKMVSKQKVMDAALPLFLRRGIKSTDLYDIAQASEISLGMLRHVFPNKQVLVAAVVEDLLVKNSKYLQVNPRLSPNATKEMDNIFQFIENLLIQFTPRFLRELRKYYSDTWNKVVEFREKMLLPYVQENIKRGIFENCYRTDIDQRIYSRIYLMSINAIAINATEAEESLGGFDRKQLLIELHHIFFHGILNKNGLRLTGYEIEGNGVDKGCTPS